VSCETLDPNWFHRWDLSAHHHTSILLTFQSPPHSISPLLVSRNTREDRCATSSAFPRGNPTFLKQHGAAGQLIGSSASSIMTARFPVG
jgi:hypothetical protein